ncbi:DUF1934 domain-containing protein [Veillonella agrestimuris]|uniref:DUF1934 domain-containing protein n=1 Tax=Veillonella agrestimuris TaxID=2941340 RepID=UPI002041009D|nr:DUF1934 domain-containing protein [Veillonella agrestimuris]
MKRVLVSVKSVQRDVDGKDTVVELISPGTWHEKNGTQYIRYEESSVTGMEGVKTTIKIQEDSIVLLRTGTVNMRHQYVRGEERESVYETPFGEFLMVVKTHELTVGVQEGVGHVHLGYDISIEGDWQFYNQLDIHVQEDAEDGHEGNPESGD